MSTRSIYGYTRKVVNRSGGVVLLPNVEDFADLLYEVDVDPFAQSSTQQYPLGTLLIEGERAWRYCLNGGVALVPGFTVQSAAIASAGHSMDMVTAAAVVGALTVTVTPVTANVTANQYKDGYLFVNDLVGEGQCFKIKSNPAITAAATGVITLYDPVTLALDATTLTGLRVNPFSGVIVTPVTTLTGIVLGASQIPVTAAYYAWIQSAGPAAINGIGTLVLGKNAIAPTGTTAGCVGPATIAYGEQVVGKVMNVCASTNKSLIYLTID